MVDRKIPELKPLFSERMKKLLPDEIDFQEYLKIIRIPPVNSIRCNTIKISPEALKKRLENKGWKVSQPWKEHPEVMLVDSALLPGELGRSFEHLLGYYYVQELSSMLPLIALKPKADEVFLDLCAAPGSKTTQASAMMENKGTIIANEMDLGRLKILASNLERCGAVNTIITKKDGRVLCAGLFEEGIILDKILVDAPCSGEGTLRSSFKTYLAWNINGIKSISKLQKVLAEKAFESLKINGEMIYSTCTHAPEENEAVVSYLLERFKGSIALEEISLPLKTRPGILEWNGEVFNSEVKKCARVYPQDNNTEGFFLAKFRRIK